MRSWGIAFRAEFGRTLDLTAWGFESTFLAPGWVGSEVSVPRFSPVFELKPTYMRAGGGRSTG